MSEPFIAEIRPWANLYPPRDWSYCIGTELLVSDNQALYAVIHNQFGGNNTATFKLPDLRNLAPIGLGQGPGLTPRIWAGKYGEATVTLLTSQMPSHTHSLVADVENAAQTNPGNGYLYAMGRNPTLNKTVNTYVKYTNSLNLVPMSPQCLAKSGGNQAHENRQPFLSIAFCIALDGIFPVKDNMQ